jgi:hypothetical protein
MFVDLQVLLSVSECKEVWCMCKVRSYMGVVAGYNANFGF